jgi:hypothetical protein
VERLSDYSDDDYHRITAERLLTDVDLALTFAEIAAARREPESRARTVATHGRYLNKFRNGGFLYLWKKRTRPS